jgi:integrase
VRAYRADWRDFTVWCEARGVNPLPATPDAVTLYLSDLAGRCKVGTLTRRISAISQAHQLAGHDTPTGSAAVRTVMAGIRRAQGTPADAKAATLTEDIRAMVAALPEGLLGVRDRALLLVGFAGAFRRSELIGLDRRDLDFGKDGLTVALRRSKTVGRPGSMTVSRLEPTPCAPTRSKRRTLPRGSGVNRHGTAARPLEATPSPCGEAACSRCGLDAARYAGHACGRAGDRCRDRRRWERAIMAQTGTRV